ncbi:MAG: type I toxin-antitoxin system SymE family toxin [Candidatus Thiodiazotropha sp. (ex Dulcina madagascariensis)]|nr:type I toxin-antitoxin system SymE family toxin [Candidatus Thiodiazotropha sp. (ex Dulcina madagascariensis)]
MGNDYSTGNPRPVKIPAERRLTVGTLVYYYPPRKDDPPCSPQRPVPVPWLQMKGHWLAEAGFGIQTPVKVRVMPGCLVLTLVED